MRLPTSLLESPYFSVRDLDTFLHGMMYEAGSPEWERASALAALGLPPIVSEDAFAFMIGINKGLVWSFANKTSRYYRTFPIPKGKETRNITAPKVAIKIPQKWLSFHLAQYYQAPDHVFGFVPGRSFLDAARVHVGAEWSWSFDIRNFFPSTPAALIEAVFQDCGYPVESASFLTKICTLRGFLPQGAPTSPILSNLAFKVLDQELSDYATEHGYRLSRYADDITLSGTGPAPDGLRNDIYAMFENEPWELLPEKDLKQPLKNRIKIHGLVIKADGVRLTKGYRNKLRTYRHILETRANIHDRAKLLGHVSYAASVTPALGEFEPFEPEETASITGNPRNLGGKRSSEYGDTPDPAADSASGMRKAT